jgi:HK97 family phage portal protein
MGLLTRLSTEKRFRAQQYAVASGYTPMSSEFIRWISGTTASGKPATEDSMMGVAAWWCCMRILAESIGMLPWSMYRKVDARNAEQADDHWLQDVLTGSPNRDQDDVEFRETKALHLVGSGNAYSMIDRAGRRVTALTPIQSRDVEPMVKSGTNSKLQVRDGEIFFRVKDRGLAEDYPREKIWQVKLFGRDRLKGLSPLGAAREAIGGALAMEEFGNRFFSQGAMPAGTVSYPGWLTKEQREIARENVQKLVGGLGRAHQVALFEGGVKPEPWGAVNLEDLQFIFARRFSVVEICRFHRVPIYMVGELEKGSAYASVEQFSQDFVTFTLMPYLTRFEHSVSKWLLPPEERGKFFLRFNVDGLLRASSKERAEFLSSMVNNGIMNRNEVRAKENLNRSEDAGMDSFTVQTALTPIDKLGQQPTPSRSVPVVP